MIKKLIKIAEEGKVIGIIFSQFDLIHAGHISTLSQAKLSCDHLIAGLHRDASTERPEKNSPIQSLLERQICLSAIDFVDDIIVYETEKDLIDILNLYPIKVRFLGEEYRDMDFTGKSLSHIMLRYLPRPHTFSSSGLRQKIVDNYLKDKHGKS